ncbi:hypothetical protein ACFLZY_03610, partial [Patescibacteria group bacterium]
MHKISLRLLTVFLSVKSHLGRFFSKPLVQVGFFVVLVAGFVFVFAVNPVLAETAAELAKKAAQKEAEKPGVVDYVMQLIGNLAINLTQVTISFVITVLDFIIPLMLYDGFSTSNVVSTGWAIVRDTVNMFFVIVLIIIAFGTILGSARFNWQQQVPRLLIFALLINFSKTLASLMIDFGQVIMLTFANALRDIAAGNFIQLFGLTDMLSISDHSTSMKSLTSPYPQPPAAFDYMGAGIAALAMSLMVLGTMIILGILLAMRIVMLWVLVILAPLAWFVGGAKDVMVKSNAYADWWSKFTCWVAIGPVLVFFLWLTLAVAGSG